MTMRALLVATPFAALGCLGVESTRERGTARGLPAWTVTLELDRPELPATDDLAGTIVVLPDPALRHDGNGVARATLEIGDWQVEFANERTPLLDLVVESEDLGESTRRLAAGGAARFRFRMAPCTAFAERSSHSPVALQRLAPGNHAMRIVAHGVRIERRAAADGREETVDAHASCASPWTPFDVVDAGRPLDADDLEWIVLNEEETRAAGLFAAYARDVMTPERMVAVVARASGLRRGHLAAAFAGMVDRGEWWNIEAWEAFRSLFTEVDDSGVDCTSHESPPFFHRLASGRRGSIRIRSSQFCNLKMHRMAFDAVSANFAVSPPGRSIDVRDLAATTGLFRVTCDVHPKIWGWLLIE